MNVPGKKPLRKTYSLKLRWLWIHLSRLLTHFTPIWGNIIFVWSKCSSMSLFFHPTLQYCVGSLWLLWFLFAQWTEMSSFSQGFTSIKGPKPLGALLSWPGGTSWLQGGVRGKSSVRSGHHSNHMSKRYFSTSFSTLFLAHIFSLARYPELQPKIEPRVARLPVKYWSHCWQRSPVSQLALASAIRCKKKANWCQWVKLSKKLRKGYLCVCVMKSNTAT